MRGDTSNPLPHKRCRLSLKTRSRLCSVSVHSLPLYDRTLRAVGKKPTVGSAASNINSPCAPRPAVNAGVENWATRLRDLTKLKGQNKSAAAVLPLPPRARARPLAQDQASIERTHVDQLPFPNVFLPAQRAAPHRARLLAVRVSASSTNSPRRRRKRLPYSPRTRRRSHPPLAAPPLCPPSSAAPLFLLRNVTAHAVRLPPLHHRAAGIALVGHRLFDPGQVHQSKIKGGGQECPPYNCGSSESEAVGGAGPLILRLANEAAAPSLRFLQVWVAIASTRHSTPCEIRRGPSLAGFQAPTFARGAKDGAPR